MRHQLITHTNIPNNLSSTFTDGVFSFYVRSIIYSSRGGGGGGGYSRKFYTGRLCPEVQSLTLLYTILTEKLPPSVVHLLLKKVPLWHTYFRILHPFSKPLKWSKNQYYERTPSITRRDINQKQILFAQFLLWLESRYSESVSIRSYTSLPFNIPEAWEGTVSLSGGTSPYRPS